MNDRDYVRDMQHKNVNALLRYLNTKSPILHLSILMDISSLINTASASSQKDEANGVVIEDDVLFNAIDSATLHRVQTVLREICTENPEAFSLACEKLLVGHEDSTATDTDTDTDTEAKDDGGPGTKRKRDTMQHRYKICTQCDEEYDILDNPEDACEWHPGETEVDHESGVWDDHDERCHGIIENLRDEYPEGFSWSCCEKAGNEEGCEVGAHKPDLRKRVKVKA